LVIWTLVIGNYLGFDDWDLEFYEWFWKTIRYGMVEMKAIQKIPIEEIDLSDETFSVNFRPDLQKLRSSIEEIGLIEPVLLTEKGDRYQILWLQKNFRIS
jgi:hypothetical protein